MLQALPDDIEPTRATLHAYAHAVAALPRAHHEPHPRWWHTSLKPTIHGLTTEVVDTDAGPVSVRMNFSSHDIHLDRNGATALVIPMDQGLTATEVAGQLIDAVALSDTYERERFTNDEQRPYDRAVAAAIWSVFDESVQILRSHNASIGGDLSPIQLWPHGFDLATEWYGTRLAEYAEGGTKQTMSAQINFGFYPAGRADFYSNPWPFEADTLLSIDLPHGASWKTDGWEGSQLYLDQVAGHADSSDRVLEYARAVFDAASPSLLA